VTGQRLHQFDLELCRYALDNIRAYLDDPEFAAFAEEQLAAPVWGYTKALGGDDEPPRLLLTDADLEDLETTFQLAPFQFDRPWEPDAALHRRCVNTVAEVRDALMTAHAEGWARLSAGFAERLEAERMTLSTGIETVHSWIQELRRLLRAMAATALLPHPEGAAPTPACPDPPALTTPPGQTAEKNDDGVLSAVAETQALQREIRDLILRQRIVKELYSTAEAAEILGKAEYTVREWRRKGQAQAQKAANGRGWLVPHAELERLRNCGPRPEPRPS
jgi:hypothetical protein